MLFYDNLHILKEKDKLSFNYNKKKYENYVLSMYLKKKEAKSHSLKYNSH